MSVVIYGVVHNHMETVFGICKQLTGYGFFSEILLVPLAVSGHHTNFNRDFKIMLAEKHSKIQYLHHSWLT